MAEDHEDIDLNHEDWFRNDRVYYVDGSEDMAGNNWVQGRDWWFVLDTSLDGWSYPQESDYEYSSWDEEYYDDNGDVVDFNRPLEFAAYVTFIEPTQATIGNFRQWEVRIIDNRSPHMVDMFVEVEGIVVAWREPDSVMNIDQNWNNFSRNTQVLDLRF
tara:strand:- start:1 stop:477 length:477 start_codon:yes stop_codon:yes gene_type:complete